VHLEIVVGIEISAAHDQARLKILPADVKLKVNGNGPRGIIPVAACEHTATNGYVVIVQAIALVIVNDLFLTVVLGLFIFFFLRRKR
jgi:hypothetical protein